MYQYLFSCLCGTGHKYSISQLCPEPKLSFILFQSFPRAWKTLFHRCFINTVLIWQFLTQDLFPNEGKGYCQHKMGGYQTQKQSKPCFSCVPWQMCWTGWCRAELSIGLSSSAQGPSGPDVQHNQTVLQGEHFNKRLQVNSHQADTDTLLTHTKFPLHSINCYKHIADKQLNPRPWGPSPLMYLHTSKGWDLKTQPLKCMAFLQALKWMSLINSDRTKPRHEAVASDWQTTGFLQRILFKMWIFNILKTIKS